MRLKFRVTATSVAVAMMVGSGSALMAALTPPPAPEQEQPEAPEQIEERPEEQPEEQPDPFVEPGVAEEQEQLLRVEQYIDMQVVNEQGEEVGQIQDVAIDVDQGRIGYVAIEPADRLTQELELDQDLYALPFEALEADAEQQQLTLTVEEQRLAEAQGFTQDEWPDQIVDRQWGQQQHEIFGFAPYWEEDEDADQQQEQGLEQLREQIRDGMEEAGVEAEQAQQSAQELAQQFQQQRPDRQQIQQQIEQRLTQAGVDEQQARDTAEQLAQDVEQRLEQVNEEGREQQQQQRGERQEMQQQRGEQPGQPQQQGEPMNREHEDNGDQPDPFVAPENGEAAQDELQVKSYDELKDMEVRDAQDEQLGTIKEFVIDTREGHVAYAAVSHGGFLGIGEELSPVPFEALEPRLDEEHFRLDATQEQLEELAFQDDQWPDLNDPQWNQQVHETYGEEPYWDVHGYAAPGEEETEEEDVQPEEHEDELMEEEQDQEQEREQPDPWF